jgi:hypothetical protein
MKGTRNTRKHPQVSVEAVLNVRQTSVCMPDAVCGTDGRGAALGTMTLKSFYCQI